MNDRRTMLGELNWIFTAVTDTIAWNSLPRGRISPRKSDIPAVKLFRRRELNFRFFRLVPPAFSSGPSGCQPVPKFLVGRACHAQLQMLTGFFSKYSSFHRSASNVVSFFLQLTENLRCIIFSICFLMDFQYFSGKS